MATQKAINSALQKNKGGSVINAGTGYDTVPVLGARLVSSRTNLGVFGSTVVKGVNTIASLDSGLFATLNSIVAKRVSDSLAGTVSNSVLLSGASVPGLTRSIHKLEALITYRQSTAFRAGNFNLYTGIYNPAPTVATDSLATDTAATPTRSVPGKMVFRTGSKVPVRSDYKAKTN